MALQQIRVKYFVHLHVGDLIFTERLKDHSHGWNIWIFTLCTNSNIPDYYMWYCRSYSAGFCKLKFDLQTVVVGNAAVTPREVSHRAGRKEWDGSVVWETGLSGGRMWDADVRAQTQTAFWIMSPWVACSSNKTDRILIYKCKLSKFGPK